MQGEYPDMRLFQSSLTVACATTLVLAAALCTHISSADAATNYDYDMGGVRSTLKYGYTRVTKDNLYDPMKRYGWTKAPDREVEVRSDPSADELTRDGVVAPNRVEFRADVASGTYFVEVTVGGSRSIGADVRVYADGVLKAKSGRFVDALGGRPRRTLRFPVEIRANSVTIAVACSEGVEVNGIAFKALAYEPFRVEGGKLVSDAPLGFPVYERGKKLFDVGQYDLAMKQFGYIPDEALQAYCRLAIGGRLDARNAKSLLRAAADSLARYSGLDEAQMSNRFDLVQKFLLGVYYYDLGAWSYAERQTELSVRQRFTIAADIMVQIAADPRDPLYHQALMYLGRIWYWMWRDQRGGYQRREADQVFRLLADEYPDYDLLSMYRGKQIAHSITYSVEAGGAPSWAAAQREALRRTMEVIDYWVQNRTRDGEFGSGYARDSELVRWWLIAVLVADDAGAREAIRRFAEQVWTSDIVENGYSAVSGDVRRAARLTSNTVPLMVAMDYGNPLYVEHCMQTMKCMRDVWTGVNARGHLHFKSARFSATSVDEQPPHAVDVPMNARAVEPGRWLCWYNRNPALVKLFTDWGRSWVEDAQRVDKSKPQGVVPAAISFARDEIGGYSNSWHLADLGSDYYDWKSGAAAPIYDQLLATYELTGDLQLLYPINTGLEMAQGFWKNPAQDVEEGTAGWVAKLLEESGFARFGCKLRVLNRVTQFDDYLGERGTLYTRFLLQGNESYLVEACQNVINSAKYNLPLLTSEVKFTDSVSVRGVDDLLSMYTGGCGLGAEYPYYAVTWSGTTRDFAALVMHATRRSLKVLAYNFEPAGRRVQMRLWRLEPGKYELRIGPDRDGDGQHDLEASKQLVEVKQRGTPVQVELTARELLLIQIAQIEKSEPAGRNLPDLALAEGDVGIRPFEPRAGHDVTVRVKVHNIGSARAENVRVVLEDESQRLGEEVIKSLDAPNDLEPKIVEISIVWTPKLARTHHLKVVVDPEDAIPEINGLNNSVKLNLSVSQ